MYNVMLRKCSDIYGQPRWSSWTELERATQVDPASIVKYALESDAFDLARQWAVAFGISASNITEKHLRSLLESRKVDEAHRLLESLSKDELMPTCNALLQHLESLEDLLFVAQFVLRSPNVKLSASRTTMLRDTELDAALYAACQTIFAPV